MARDAQLQETAVGAGVSCRRRCAVELLFSCLRGYPGGVRTCMHGRLWRLKTDQDHFYVVAMWSPWRRRWVASLVETVMLDDRCR